MCAQSCIPVHDIAFFREIPVCHCDYFVVFVQEKIELQRDYSQGIVPARLINIESHAQEPNNKVS